MTTKRRRKTKIVHIHGRRWFERVNGNTYHSVTMYVNGECVGKVDFQYGYGDQWVWTARDWLAEQGYLPGIIHGDGTPGESLWRYCEVKGIKFTQEVDDVRRKKDL
jgi:hypothetical protein